MAGIDYDGIAGILRVVKAGGKTDNFAFAIEVITYHAAIEAELEAALRPLMTDPDAFFSRPKPSFAHKAKLLQAMWKKDKADAEKLGKVFRALQDLRDEVAHTDANIKPKHTNLTIAFREITTEHKDEYSMLEVAQGICSFMSDGETVEDVAAALAQLDKLVNVDLPAALGDRRQ